MPAFVSVGFWSYVHSDDEYEQGRISRLRDRLEKSIRFHSGRSDFQIFLDKKDIGWGQQWRERIENSLSDALLLFPIVTPSYFESAACRSEYLAFQERQKKLGRDDLVLPIYYLSADAMDGNAIDSDPHDVEIAQQLLRHQYEDFRSLRVSEETDPSYSKAIERLGSRANGALKRGLSSKSSAPDAPISQAKLVEDQATEQAGVVNDSAPTIQQSSPGHIIALSVHQMPGRGDFTSILEAVARAPGGARITIHPGHYRETVTIDKPLELIGSGNVEDIVIESDHGNPLIFDTNIGLIRNLTIRRTASSKAKSSAAWIKQGRLELEDCDISCSESLGVRVSTNADPRLRRNRVHNAGESGIIILSGASGTYEDNEFFGCRFAGIAVCRGAFPVVRRNRAYNNRQSGIYIYDDGGGVYEYNEVFENDFSGVAIKNSNPVVRSNRIFDNKIHGVQFSEGRGTLEDNQIIGNSQAGVYVKDKANVAVRRNKINGNGYEGIWVERESEGIFWENELLSNRRGAWDLEGVDLEKLSIERNIEARNDAS